jgi:hypothetical protein
MYSEEIKYLSHDLGETAHSNKLRNDYFENRSCLVNVLDFLDQEVVIMPSSYFSYSDRLYHLMEDDYVYLNINEDSDRWYFVFESLEKIYCHGNYHLCILDNYIAIVDNSWRCIFTNKDMSRALGKESFIIGTIFWVKNFNELLKKYSDRNLKRVSKSIVCPIVTKINSLGEEFECLDEELFLSMDIYKPEVIFKYSIDTYMSNICIDVYNKLLMSGLNGLVDKYIPSYKQCDGYGEEFVEDSYSKELCKCGGLRAFCYLDI